MNGLRIILLVLRTHAVWPSYPDDTVRRVVLEAVASETLSVPAEFLVVVAQHESDFEPGAVSWVQHRKRVDLVWTETSRQPPNTRSTCGLVQAMAASRADCAAVIADHGGMTRGASELAEWAHTCHGDLGCIARGHAGGTACARRRSACSRAARKISDYFVAATRRLRRPR